MPGRSVASRLAKHLRRISESKRWLLLSTGNISSASACVVMLDPVFPAPEAMLQSLISQTLKIGTPYPRGDVCSDTVLTNIKSRSSLIEIIPNGLDKRHLIGNWLSQLGVNLAIKSGLLHLRSSQPHLAACQAYHTSDHVRTALGNSRCNLAAGQAAARRINTALVAPRIRKLEIPHAGNWQCARSRTVRYRTSYLGDINGCIVVSELEICTRPR